MCTNKTTMNTPVLTKKQQRQSLSGKKGGATKGLRNILAHPSDTYWPVVKEDIAEKLGAYVKQVLHTVKKPSERECIKIPWSRLRHMNKDERNEVKKQAVMSSQSQLNKNSKPIVLGINAVTRSLEKNDICCVLLDATVEPVILIKHIILMAQNKMIPLLLLPSLKKLSNECLGFSCSALALKNLPMDSMEDQFLQLYEYVCVLSEDYPPPKRSLSLNFKFEETIKSDILEDEQKEENDTEKDEKKQNLSTISEAVESTTIADVYLYRMSHKERIFIPKCSTRNLDTVQDNTIEFISFNTTFTEKESIEDNTVSERYFKIHEDKMESIPMETDESKKSAKLNNKQNNKEFYLPLKVKRIQGNPKRIKATKISKQKR